jgi:hypothetical protein
VFAERLRNDYPLRVKGESKNGGSDSTTAQTFTFRELAIATKNFRAECLLGEGGFGRVYKGYLESTNQVGQLLTLCKEQVRFPSSV